MAERGIDVSYESIRTWVFKFSHHYDTLRRRRTKYYTLSWHVDETYIKIKGQNYYYNWAIDSHGQVIDFYLSQYRDSQAAQLFLEKAIATAGSFPEKITSDGDKAYPIAISQVDCSIEHWVNKYLNNRIEWDHRTRIKRRDGGMKGFGNIASAAETLTGMESVYELRRLDDFKGWQELDHCL